jgi:hypothetical protein
LHERIENNLFLDRTRKDSNFKHPRICLKDPLILYDGKGFGDHTRLLQEFGVSLHEGAEAVFGHVGDQVVERFCQISGQLAESAPSG